MCFCFIIVMMVVMIIIFVIMIIFMIKDLSVLTCHCKLLVFIVFFKKNLREKCTGEGC